MKGGYLLFRREVETRQIGLFLAFPI